MRIGVYGSMRNEEQNLDAWLASVEDADVVVLNDTGSTDHSFKMAQRRALRDGRLYVSQLPVEPMLLCNALNIAIGQLPEDVDLAIRLDLDERLAPGWRVELEQIWADHDGPPLVVFPWFDHGGNEYKHNRIHSRHGYHWDLPVHEVLVGPYGVVALGQPGTRWGDLTIVHLQDPNKDRSGVLQELIDAYTNDPTNERWQHYLGREYSYRGDWVNALPLLRLHAESAAWDEERSESWRLIGDGYCALMPAAEVSLTPYRNATIAAPHRREGWVRLAFLSMQQGRWLEAVEAADRAIAITAKSAHSNQPFAWSGQPFHIAAVSSDQLGRSNDALRYGRRAVELEPDNELYVSNLGWYERKVARASV